MEMGTGKNPDCIGTYRTTVQQGQGESHTMVMPVFGTVHEYGQEFEKSMLNGDTDNVLMCMGIESLSK